MNLLSISAKKCDWYFNRDYIESVDHFEWYWHLKNITSSDLWTWNIFSLPIFLKIYFRNVFYFLLYKSFTILIPKDFYSFFMLLQENWFFNFLFGWFIANVKKCNQFLYFNFTFCWIHFLVLTGFFVELTGIFTYKNSLFPICMTFIAFSLFLLFSFLLCFKLIAFASTTNRSGKRGYGWTSFPYSWS